MTVTAGATTPVTVTNTAAVTTYAITKNVSPTGSGTVNCDTDPVPHNGTSNCTATANPGYTFANWSGDCTGTGACELTNVTSTKSVTANFTLVKTFTGPTITYPSALLPQTVYWKFGPTPGNPSSTWYQMPANIAGNTTTFTITDGGLGDDDLDNSNGVIVDQGGPGVPGVGDGATGIPTLSEWGLLLFAILLGLLGFRRPRHGA